MRKILFNHTQKGFTLIELLIVIVIIAALAVAIFVALNPTKRLQDAKNARRITDIESIRQAINQYVVDKGVLPAGLTAGMQETQLGTSNGTGVGVNNVSCVNTTGSCSAMSQSCVDLTAPLANYLKSIPIDPKIGSASATGYSVSVDANNSVTVKACGTEGVAVSKPIGVPGNWTMKFDDEFNTTTLNTSVWTPGWFGTGITQSVNSSETACYDTAQVSMPGDGYLHLHLISQPVICRGSTQPYTGSLVSSNPSDGVSGHTGYQYTYGYVEWRVYIPPTVSGQVANWPATWSTGQNWPTDGENDTMEGLGGPACYHFHSPAGGPGNCAGGNYGGWHTFGSNWQPGRVDYYYDGSLVGSITTGITSSPQYLIMDNTTSASSPTSVPADMQIDYVRVWQ